MHIRQYLSSSPRDVALAVALVSVLLIGLFLPQSALAASTWANTAPMSIARDAHTATLLPSGKVLMVGGFDGGGGGYFTSAEVYDPGVDTWTTVASAARCARLSHGDAAAERQGAHCGGPQQRCPRRCGGVRLERGHLERRRAPSHRALGHTATLLPGGKILVAGGFGGVGGYLTSAEAYHPGANAGPLSCRCTPGARTRPRRCRPAARCSSSGAPMAPLSPAWRCTIEARTLGLLSRRWKPRRVAHTATLLPSGKVLVAGGYTTGGLPKPAEVYDPSENTWTTVAALGTERTWHTATLLPNGSVLVAGGFDAGA